MKKYARLSAAAAAAFLSLQATALCASENIDKEPKPDGSGAKIVNMESDLDWKDIKASIPWSELIKVTSKLSGDSYYLVFDRDYNTNNNNGLTEGFATRWTNESVTGYQYFKGGCGLWVCTFGSGITTFGGTIQIFYAGESFLLYGDSGEYQLPQKLRDLIIKTNGSESLSIKLSEGRDNQKVFSIGPNTKKSLAVLFTKENKVWPIPKINLTPMKVQADELPATKVVPKVLPSVVSIRSDNALGSGFVFTDDGLILTNRHVVSGSGVSKYELTADNGSKAQGEVIYIDKQLDFAIIKPQTSLRIGKLPICYKAYPAPGQDVIALGSPDGIAGTVTKGVVSAVRKPTDQLKGMVPDDATLVQHDAAISPGNSGGPLVNSRGELLGVNTYVIPTTSGGRINQNLNFAISIVDVLRSLKLRPVALPMKAKENDCGNFN